MVEKTRSCPEDLLAELIISDIPRFVLRRPDTYEEFNTYGRGTIEIHEVVLNEIEESNGYLFIEFIGYCKISNKKKETNYPYYKVGVRKIWNIG